MRISPWSRLLLQKLTAAEESPSEANCRSAIQEIPRFLGGGDRENSLPCLKQPATGPYPEPDESSPYIHTLFL